MVDVKFLCAVPTTINNFVFSLKTELDGTNQNNGKLPAASSVKLSPISWRAYTNVRSWKSGLVHVSVAPSTSHVYTTLSSGMGRRATGREGIV